MAAKKQSAAVAKRIADRKAFVAEQVASKGISKEQARQRFFVKTRIAELKAAGKAVTPEVRKQLQQKFQSGNVSREGFGAPKKKTGGSSSSAAASVSSKPSSTPEPVSSVRKSSPFKASKIADQKGYTYTEQSGKKSSYKIVPEGTRGANVKYSRPQIVRNVDMNTKKQPKNTKK